MSPAKNPRLRFPQLARLLFHFFAICQVPLLLFSLAIPLAPPPSLSIGAFLRATDDFLRALLPLCLQYLANHVCFLRLISPLFAAAKPFFPPFQNIPPLLRRCFHPYAPSFSLRVSSSLDCFSIFSPPLNDPFRPTRL